MQLKIFRSASIGACVAAIAAIGAGSAQAAITATTGPVSAVTPVSATFSGTVDTGGADTPWVFSYCIAGTTFGCSYSRGGDIPAGATAPTPVTDTVTTLTPSTSYTVQLIAQAPGAGGFGYLVTPVYGGLVNFRTSGPGVAGLTSQKLKVKFGHVKVVMRCARALACTGGVLAITTHHSGKRVACGTANFNIPAGRKKTILTHKVSPRCASLLAAAPNGKITAQLLATFNYQKQIFKGVTLVLA